MTQILNLPLLSLPITIANNEDWTDALAYLDVSAASISLAGLTLVMMLRARAQDPTVQVVASSVSGAVNGLPQTGSISSGGAGLNVVALAIPRATVAKLSPGKYAFEVQATGEGRTYPYAESRLVGCVAGR